METDCCVKKSDAPRPVAAAISAVVKGDTILLVQRRNQPGAGLWGLPGGKIEPGESVHQAALRELHEETGLRAVAERTFTAVDVFRRDSRAMLRHHYILIAVLCRDPAGVLAPGSDAADARWFRLDEIEDAAWATNSQVAEVAREAMMLASSE